MICFHCNWIKVIDGENVEGRSPQIPSRRSSLNRLLAAKGNPRVVP